MYVKSAKHISKEGEEKEEDEMVAEEEEGVMW